MSKEIMQKGLNLDPVTKERLARIIELRRTQRIARGDWPEFPIVNKSKIVDVGEGRRVYEPGVDPMRDEFIAAAQIEVGSWSPGLGEKLDKMFSSDNPVAKAIDWTIDQDLGVKQA